MPTCPVCGSDDTKSTTNGHDLHLFDCPNCGRFSLFGMLVGTFGLPVKPGTIESAILSQTIRKMQRKNAQELSEWPMFTFDEIHQIIKDAHLPSPAQQADNIIIWLGDNLEDSGTTINILYDHFRAIAGASTDMGVAFIVRWLLDERLIDCQGQNSQQLRHSSGTTLTLSMGGWQRYEAIKRGVSDSRKAFMAMEFGDDALDAVFRDCFKPAIAQTGFDLVRLDEKPKAGLIDDRLRVEIRSSRFIVADLTHKNLGAYWEAGYAEGLGKPVIYTCEQEVFNREKTHFDTNHHLTVPWDQANLADAAQRLKDTVRATLPLESKLND